jgi:hypothetical protein
MNMAENLATGYEGLPKEEADPILPPIEPSPHHGASSLPSDDNELKNELGNFNSYIPTQTVAPGRNHDLDKENGASSTPLLVIPNSPSTEEIVRGDQVEISAPDLDIDLVNGNDSISKSPLPNTSSEHEKKKVEYHQVEASDCHQVNGNGDILNLPFNAPLSENENGRVRVGIPTAETILDPLIAKFDGDSNVEIDQHKDSDFISHTTKLEAEKIIENEELKDHVKPGDNAASAIIDESCTGSLQVSHSLMDDTPQTDQALEVVDLSVGKESNKPKATGVASASLNVLNARYSSMKDNLAHVKVSESLNGVKVSGDLCSTTMFSSSDKTPHISAEDSLGGSKKEIQKKNISGNSLQEVDRTDLRSQITLAAIIEHPTTTPLSRDHEHNHISVIEPTHVAHGTKKAVSQELLGKAHPEHGQLDDKSSVHRSKLSLRPSLPRSAPLITGVVAIIFHVVGMAIASGYWAAISGAKSR